nr:MAG TPA: hypothetical protein [Caudoviricetes sp.]
MRIALYLAILILTFSFSIVSVMLFNLFFRYDNCF